MTTFILPLVSWRPHPHEDDVTCILPLATPSHPRLVAGTESGRIWIFSFLTTGPTGPTAPTTPNATTPRSLSTSYSLDAAAPCLEPRTLLVGHSAPVTCLAFNAQDTESALDGGEHVVLSASESGEIAIWNLTDGQCLHVNVEAFPGVPRTLAVSGCCNYLFVGGQAAQLVVLDAQTLEPIVVSSELNDWILQVDVLASSADGKTYLAALTATCLAQFVFDANTCTLSLVFSAAIANSDELLDPNFTAMVRRDAVVACIGRKSVMLYTWSIGKIQLMGSINTPKGEADWVGGLFHGDALVLWTKFNTIYAFQLSSSIAVPMGHIKSTLKPPILLTRIGSSLLACSGESFELLSVQISETQPPILTSSALPSFSIRDFWSSTSSLTTPITPVATHHPEAIVSQALLPGYHTVVRGTSLGRLQLASYARLFGAPDLDVQAHTGPINCLLALTTSTSNNGAIRLPAAAPQSPSSNISGGSSSTQDPASPAAASQWPLLVTGGHDSLVKVFSSRDLTELAVFRHHGSPIVRIVQVPMPAAANTPSMGPPSGSYFQHLHHQTVAPSPVILTVGQSHSIGVVRLDDGALLHWIPNSPDAPVEVAWRDDLLLVAYRAGGAGGSGSGGSAALYVHVIDSRSGAVDRVVRGDTAVAVLSGCYPRVNIDRSATVGAGAAEALSSRAALSVVGMDANHVFMVNVKRVVSDSEVGLAHSLADALITRGVRRDMDLIVEQDAPELGSGVVGGFGEGKVTLGIRGTNGNLALMAPHQRDGLSISPTVTATRLLATYLVARCLMQHGPPQPASDAAFAAQFQAYLEGLPAHVGETFAYPSLSFLARYWHDSLPALQMGARVTFTWTLSRLPATRIAQVTQYWTSHLPSVVLTSTAAVGAIAAGAGGMSKTMTRAAVIMAVIGCEHPILLSPLQAREAAISLTMLLADHPHGGSDSGSGGVAAASVYKLSAIEMLGRGFATWEPYIQGPAVVRTLIAIGMQLPPGTAGGPGAGVSAAATNVAVAHAAMARQALLTISQHTLAMVVQAVVTELEHGGSGGSSGASSTTRMHPTAGGTGTDHHGSASSLIPVGGGPAAVVVVLAPADKLSLLRFVAYLAVKLPGPLAATGSAARLAEAVVRALDPAAKQHHGPPAPAAHHTTAIHPTPNSSSGTTDPTSSSSSVRETILPAATATLFELVRRFPTIAFHSGAQRLTAGHPDGRVAVWDVRTAARAAVVDAHTTPVSAVAFAADGKSVVSYAAAEHAIKVWSPPSGFLSLMGAVVAGGALPLKAVRVISHMPPPPPASGSSATWAPTLTVTDKVIDLVEGEQHRQYPYA
ncbi:hypothetical protein BC828DRAFT_407315 [Blastocladiella britannica]|nr:hypothetical protein BC828DRAFT_407315 [Blastocladiella britannica]